MEVGCEELPARFVAPAIEGLAAAIGKLAGAPVTRAWATPRRLAVAVEVAAARPTTEKLLTGPPVTADPAPFARAKGVDVGALEQIETPKGKVWGARQTTGGEPTAEVVGKGLEEAVLSVPFKKSMKWGARAERWGRPIRYVCAVIDGERVAATVAGLRTVDTSEGHWLWSPEPFRVERAAQWEEELLGRLVIADAARRRAEVERMVGELGGELDAALLDEVANLVEAPSALVGRFDEGLLELPPRLLVESMKKNQRYFPIFEDGKLTARFVVVTNNPRCDPALVAEGNARVLAARFYDAKFFYAEDRKKPLAAHAEKLAGMTWIRGLGTMAERQEEVARAGERLAPLVGADVVATGAAGRLCKADLTTLMVGEFPELQGHVGRLLAELDGRPRDVALAVEEHYLPRFAGDALPTTGTGLALALADRVTLLQRTFAAGMAPKGSADPLGLRRAANGVVALVLAAGWRGDVRELFVEARAGEDLVEFVIARLRATLQAEGHATDLVDAVLAAGAYDLAHAAARVRAMSALARTGAFAPIRATFRRAGGLVKEHASTAYDPALFEHDAERALHEAFLRVPHDTDVDAALASLAALRPSVDRLFDAVLVMCDDARVRDNRLGLLRAIVARFSSLADFSRLSTD